MTISIENLVIANLMVISVLFIIMYQMALGDLKFWKSYMANP